MKISLAALFLVAAVPAFCTAASDKTEVVVQVVQRDLDRDGVTDRAQLVRRGASYVLILEKGGYADPEGRQELFIHPQNFDEPALVYNETARYLMLGQAGVGWKAWILRDGGDWMLVADSRSGIDGTRRGRTAKTSQ